MYEGLVRAQVGVATSIASLAWMVVEGSRAVDTITVVMRHPDKSTNQWSFEIVQTQPTSLRALWRELKPCALPT